MDISGRDDFVDGRTMFLILSATLSRDEPAPTPGSLHTGTFGANSACVVRVAENIPGQGLYQVSASLFGELSCQGKWSLGRLTVW